ncbi:MAG: phosphatidylglycerophosphatase A [Ignavibacteriae bacterium]|nr:phosphatidylglycerophosphatase A [Ignavibacteriota bacterium]
MLKTIKLFIGTGFFSGYFPKAPGTMGSLVALMFLLIPGFSESIVIIPAIIISIIVGIPLGNYFEKIYGEDPQIFTLDEFVGTWITFLFVPIKLETIILGFLVWRILDIVKPFPANRAEKLKGGWGIMMDDIVSGVYSLLIIHIFISLFI